MMEFHTCHNIYKQVLTIPFTWNPGSRDISHTI